MGYKVAVVGATGNVGREILAGLAERDFPAHEVMAVASERSAGSEVSYGEVQVLKVQYLKKFDFSDADIAFFSSVSRISAEFAPRAAESGCIMIDNSSLFRMDPDIPLIVPEVHREAIAGYSRKNVIANPNCSTIQLVMALKPLHDLAPINRVVVATYQSTSGAGREAMDELFTQTRAIYANQPVRREHFSKQIAFNVIPHIDSFMDDGATREEWKMVVETKKILDPDIELHATCVRVPVFIGHAEAVTVEFDTPLSEDEARSALRAAEGVSLVDHRVDEGYVTPVECAGEDAVYISRLRRDATVESGLSFWVVADNLRKGAALNSVQIAERLVEEYL